MPLKAITSNNTAVFSCNLDLLTDVGFGSHLEYPDGSVPMVAKTSSGRMSPVRARTMKEYDQQMTELKKENFSLKLRIYFLEERIEQKFGDGEDVFKTNIELKVEVESLKKELSDKHELLKKAANAMENLSSNHQIELEKIRDHVNRELHNEKLELESQLQKSNEEIESLRKELENTNSHLVDVIAESEKQKKQQKELLQKGDNKIQELQKTLMGLQKELEELGKVNKNKDREIEQLQTEKAQFEEQVQKMEKDVVRKDRDLEQLSSVVKNNTLVDSESFLVNSHLQDVVDDQKEDLKGMQARVTELGQRVRDKDDMIARLEDLLRNKEKDAKELDNSLKQLKDELDSLKDEKIKYKKTVYGLIKSHKEKEEEIEDLKIKLKDNEEELKKSKEELQDYAIAKQKELDDKHDELAFLEAKLTSTQTQLKEGELELENLTRKLGKKEGELEGFKDLLSKAESALQESEDAVEALQGQLQKHVDGRSDSQAQHYQRLYEDGQKLLEDKDQMLQQLTQALKDKDRQLQQAMDIFQPGSKDGDSTNLMLQKLEEKLKEKEKDLSKLEEEKFQELEEKDDEIRKLKNMLREKERDLERANHMLMKAEESVESEWKQKWNSQPQGQKEVHKLEREVIYLKEQLIRQNTPPPQSQPYKSDVEKDSQLSDQQIKKTLQEQLEELKKLSSTLQTERHIIYQLRDSQQENEASDQNKALGIELAAVQSLRHELEEGVERNNHMRTMLEQKIGESHQNNSTELIDDLKKEINSLKQELIVKDQTIQILKSQTQELQNKLQFQLDEKLRARTHQDVQTSPLSESPRGRIDDQSSQMSGSDSWSSFNRSPSPLGVEVPLNRQSLSDMSAPMLRKFIRQLQQQLNAAEKEKSDLRRRLSSMDSFRDIPGKNDDDVNCLPQLHIEIDKLQKELLLKDREIGDLKSKLGMDLGHGGERSSLSSIVDLQNQVLKLRVQLKNVEELNLLLKKQINLNSKWENGPGGFDPNLVVQMAEEIQRLKSELSNAQQNSAVKMANGDVSVQTLTKGGSTVTLVSKAPLVPTKSHIPRLKARNGQQPLSGDFRHTENVEFLKSLLTEAKNKIEQLEDKLNATEGTVRLQTQKMKYYRGLLEDHGLMAKSPVCTRSNSETNLSNIGLKQPVRRALSHENLAALSPTSPLPPLSVGSLESLKYGDFGDTDNVADLKDQVVKLKDMVQGYQKLVKALQIKVNKGSQSDSGNSDDGTDSTRPQRPEGSPESPSRSPLADLHSKLRSLQQQLQETKDTNSELQHRLSQQQTSLSAMSELKQQLEESRLTVATLEGRLRQIQGSSVHQVMESQKQEIGTLRKKLSDSQNACFQLGNWLDELSDFLSSLSGQDEQLQQKVIHSRHLVRSVSSSILESEDGDDTKADFDVTKNREIMLTEALKSKNREVQELTEQLKKKNTQVVELNHELFQYQERLRHVIGKLENGSLVDADIKINGNIRTGSGSSLGSVDNYSCLKSPDSTVTNRGHGSQLISQSSTLKLNDTRTSHMSDDDKSLERMRHRTASGETDKSPGRLHQSPNAVEIMEDSAISSQKSQRLSDESLKSVDSRPGNVTFSGDLNYISVFDTDERLYDRHRLADRDILDHSFVPGDRQSTGINGRHPFNTVTRDLDLGNVSSNRESLLHQQNELLKSRLHALEDLNKTMKDELNLYDNLYTPDGIQSSPQKSFIGIQSSPQKSFIGIQSSPQKSVIGIQSSPQKSVIGIQSSPQKSFIGIQSSPQKSVIGIQSSPQKSFMQSTSDNIESDLLREHLAEIRALRLRLEKSLKDSDRLGERLMEDLGSKHETGPTTNVHIYSQQLATIQELQHTIQLLRQQLADKSSGSHDNQQTIEKLRTIIVEKETIVRDSQTFIHKISQQLKEKEDLIKEKIVMLGEKEKELGQKNASLKEKEHQLKQDCQSLVVQQKRIEQQDKALKQLQNELELTEQAMQDQKQQIKDQVEKIKLLEQKVRLQADKIETQAEQIKQYESTVKKQEEKVKGQERTIKLQDEQVVKQEQTIHRQAKILKEQEGILDKKEDITERLLQKNNKLEENIRKATKEIKKLQQENENLQEQMNENQDINKTLKLELSVYEKLQSEDSGSSKSSKGSVLKDLLTEIRNLRVMLERTIETNNGLRQKLEEHLSHQMSPRSARTVSVFNVHKEQSPSRSDGTDATDGKPSSDKPPYHLSNYGNGTDKNRHEHTNGNGRNRSHDSERSDFSASTPSEESTSDHVAMATWPLSTSDRNNPVLQTLYSSRSSLGGTLHHSLPNLDNYMSTSFTQHHRPEEYLSYHVYDPPGVVADYISSQKIDTDIRNLFAVGKIDDYEKLKKENGESVAVLKGIQARINERLKVFRTASPLESVEYSTLKELSLSAENLRICMNEEQSLIGCFWTTQLPKGDNSELKMENDALRNEVYALQTKYGLASKMIHDAEERLHTTNQQKQNMEDIIYRNLKKTENVMTKVRRNMEPKRKDSDCIQPGKHYKDSH